MRHPRACTTAVCAILCAILCATCVPSLCAPLPCERRPHEHHTRPRLTLLFCTHWCPGDREKLRAPQLPRCSPGADTELFTSIHPLGGRRRPSPHPVPPVRRGAARSAPACRQSEEPGTPPRPGPAHPRLRAVPVPPPPLPVAVTAGWIGAAAPRGFVLRAATSETATKNIARPAVTSKPSGPGNESRRRAAPPRDRTRIPLRGRGTEPRLSPTHPIAPRYLRGSGALAAAVRRSVRAPLRPAGLL